MAETVKPKRAKKAAETAPVANRKYEMVTTDTTQSWDGRTLFRIRALVAIGYAVAVGDLGGYVEKEANLAHEGKAWVSGNAHVFGDARVFGNASVFGNARVSGDASVSGNARVFGNASVSGDASVYGNARVFGNASVFGNAHVYGVNIVATRTDGYTFLVAPTPDGPRIIAGCRYFSFEEAEAHWTKARGGTQLGDESLALVCHLRRMAEINWFMAPIVETEA